MSISMVDALHDHYGSFEEWQEEQSRLRANRFYGEEFKRFAALAQARGFPPLPTKRRPEPTPCLDAVLKAAAERRRDILLIASPRDGVWSLNQLLEIAAATVGLPALQLRADRREQTPTRARQTYCWLARRFTEASLNQIGNQIGGRDHTTVLHAIKRVQDVVDDMPADPAMDDPRSWAAAVLSAKWHPAKVRARA